MPADTRRGGHCSVLPAFLAQLDLRAWTCPAPAGPAGCRAGGSDGQCAGFSVQNMNGCEEGVEFLPANNSRKVEKGGPRRWVVLVAVLAAFLALSLLAGLLAWRFQGE